MESIMNNSVWQPTSNFCRCCLSESCYKDITSEYYYCGQKEIYQEMLKETFNIQVPPSENYNKYMICEACIIKLRDSHNFKQAVLRSIDSFTAYLDSLKCNEDKETKIESPELKTESIKIETLPIVDLDFDIKCDDVADDASFDDDDEILANIKMELTRSYTDDAILDNATATRKKKTKEKRNKTKCKIKDENGIDNKLPNDKDWTKIAERRGNGPILRENSLKLISNSTMCVFQWNKSRYRCFCCKEPFSDMEALREHTNKAHTIENIEKKIILQQNRLVKVEVTTLFCKICNEKLENIGTLREHLNGTHAIKFELNDDLLVPFKIGANLQCQLCSEKFSVFRHLNIHMNKHYQKQVCHICGAGFSNLVFLNLHKTRSHRPLKCKECNLIFKNKLEKKNHDVNIHNLKMERKLRFPCPYCHERFFQENFRVQHLVSEHGMKKPEHKCSVCSKVFITRSLCNNHVKNVHMKEKNQECDICHNLFYSKYDVSRHRVTHTGEKKFLCSLCNNPFATKDSLRRHMKRTHVGAH